MPKTSSNKPKVSENRTTVGEGKSRLEILLKSSTDDSAAAVNTANDREARQTLIGQLTEMGFTLQLAEIPDDDWENLIQSWYMRENQVLDSTICSKP